LTAVLGQSFGARHGLGAHPAAQHAVGSVH
jgi:hypothetical protein